MYQFSTRSRQKMSGIHPDLYNLLERAIQVTMQDFSVIEGIRGIERQRMLVRQGKSQTMNSRHLTGHAADLVPFPVTWDWRYFFPIADAMITSAKELNIPLRWGGNWQVNDVREWEGTAKELNQAYDGDFPDGPHFELPREFY